MKKLLNIALGLFIGAMAMTACDDDDDQPLKGFSIDLEEVTLGADGGSQSVAIASECEWVAKSDAPWLNISPANGTGNTECTVVVDSTMSDKVRQAQIIFKTRNGESKTLAVSQTGYGKTIGVDKEEIEIKSTDKREKRFFEVKVTTNVPFKAELLDAEGTAITWIYPHDNKQFDVELDRRYRPRTTKVRFDWMVNTAEAERVAHIKMVPAHEEDAEATTSQVVVTQASAPVITDNRAGDSLAVLLIAETMNCMNKHDGAENMRNWEGVTLWERKAVEEEGLPAEAIGRIRSVRFELFDTKDGLPNEVSKLKYAENLVFFSNVNSNIRNIEGTGDNDPLKPLFNLQYLKKLTVSAYGLTDLSQDFADALGHQLEYLDVSISNFTTIPYTVTESNFPALKSLNLGACRIWTLSDLREKDDPKYYNNGTKGIGMYFNAADNYTFQQLFLWEKLEALTLSYNYIEGELPAFDDGTVPVYSEADAWGIDPKTGNDSIEYAITNRLPKILPNCKALRLNLNFFTGNAPKWLTHHPRLLGWSPSILIFNQMEEGKNTSGQIVRFDNNPGEDYSYYEACYPSIYKKYETKDFIDEE